MRRVLGALLATFWLCVSWAATESYDFPFDDPWVATVVGTPESYRAEVPEKIPLKQRSLKIFEDRKVPEFVWYDEELRYGQALQKKRAPLVFIIAGTGAGYNSAKNTNMAKAFYQAGFHVVLLPSPTFMNFIVAASETSVPGHAYKDAEDLYRVMERIWGRLKKRTKVTDFYVTGYSLGGFNTAFVTWLDEQRKVFNFRKALLINPPVRLYSSISKLDRMLQNIPGGVDNFAEFYNKLVNSFAGVYKRSDTVLLNEDFLYKVYEALKPKNEELAALVGTSFRISAANLAFTSDVMVNYGYVKPTNLIYRKNSAPGNTERVVYRLGFTDYFHAFFYPYYRDTEYPGMSRDELIGKMSLADIEDYLRGAEKIEVIHNQDDIILAPGEIDFFPRVFGARAKIYPTGGHCGNMEFRDNVAHMLSVFTE
jgi:hypothetical protein